MSRIRKGLTLAAIAAGALLSAALTTGTAGAATMRMAAEPSDVGLMHWWAIDKGIFKKNGLDFAFTHVNTAAIGLQGIGANSNDAVSLTEPPIVFNVSKGVEVKIVASVALGQGVFKLVAPKSVTSVEQLKGKKLSWMGGTGGEYALIQYLSKKNLAPKDFQFVNLEPSEGVPALINGSVDAIWEWEPWNRKAMSIKPGAYHVLGSSSDDTYQGYYITVVRKQFADENPEAVTAYLKSLGEAIADITAKPDEAAEYYAKRLRISVPEAKEAISDYKMGLQLNATVLKSLTDVSDYLVANGKVAKKVDWKSIVEPKYLKAVDPKLVKDF